MTPVQQIDPIDCNHSRVQKLLARLARGDDCRTRVVKLNCPEGLPLFIKAMPICRLRDRIKHRLRPPHHAREMAQRLQAAGLDSASTESCGILRARSQPRPLAYVVTRDVGGVRLDQWLKQVGTEMPRLRLLLHSMGRVFGRLHKAGIHHQDPRCHNFFVHFNHYDQTEPRLSLIDLEGLYPLPIIPRAMLGNRLRSFWQDMDFRLGSPNWLQMPSARRALIDGLAGQVPDLGAWAQEQPSLFTPSPRQN